MKSLSLACGLALWLALAAAAGAQTALESIRVFSTAPARFEYLFTGASGGADGKPVLSFNHRSGRTFFVRPGEYLGAWRVAAYESRTNRVFYPSLGDYLDKPTGYVTLAAAGKPAVILEQNRPLPRPGRVAWLVKLDNGLWWNVQEEDVFLSGGKLFFVEEIDEAGVVVTAGQDPAFIRRVGDWEKATVERLWAEQKRAADWDQELERVRRLEETKARTAGGGASYVYIDRGPHIEIRGPTRFFYGVEYRLPTAYQAGITAVSRDGQLVGVPIITPSAFEDRFSGISITIP